MTRKVIKGFDDWSESVSHELTFRRLNGDEDVFRIYALSEATRKMIADEYDKVTLPKPTPPIGKGGMPRVNDRHYQEAVKEYEKSLSDATDITKCLYIEHGWAVPNKITIPGETSLEKMDALSAKVAGDLDKLYLNIIRLSNLGQDDIDFF